MKTRWILTAFMVFSLAFCFDAAAEKPKVVYCGNDEKQVIDSLDDAGCKVRHKMKDITSFNCPESASLNPKAKEAEILHIVDSNADVQIEADKVWAEGIYGTDVKVAILDTGVDTDHSQLYDSYLGGYDFVNVDGSPEDDHGHGTHVAGIITGNSGTAKGVAPGAKFYMYKVCSASGSCLDVDMIAAMEAAMGTDAKVMSISIGGGNYYTENCSTTLANKVNEVAATGITVVVASGNDGKGVSSPGCAAGAIAVGAVDSTDAVTWWSNRGPALDIVAPGVSIYSTYLNNGYATMSGTSMATPHVSGVVALLLDANSLLTTDQIKTALYDNADPVTKCTACTRFVGTSCLRTATVSCTEDITGAGVVNAYKAYLAVKPTGCSADSDCSYLSDPCNDGICAVANNTCVAVPKAQGTSCSDGLACNGAETCAAGKCAAGTQVDCSSWSDPCNVGTCSEPYGACAAVQKDDGTPCSDGAFCNGEEKCSAGSCQAGTPIDCGDAIDCTTDSCNEDADACSNLWPACGASDGCCAPGCTSASDTDCPAVMCWSASNKYLLKDKNQAKKFCKCATGTYGYKSYSSKYLSTTAYKYVDSSNSTNWAVTQVSSTSPVYSVRCLNGISYTTNQSYYVA